MWWLASCVAEAPAPPADLLDLVDALGAASVGPENVTAVLGVPLVEDERTGHYDSWISAEAAPGRVRLLVASSADAPDGGRLSYELPPDAPCSRVDDADARYGMGGIRIPSHNDRRVQLKQTRTWHLPWADLALSYADGCATDLYLTLPRTLPRPGLFDRIATIAEEAPFRPERVAEVLGLPPLRARSFDGHPTRWESDLGTDFGWVTLAADGLADGRGATLEFEDKDRFACASRAEAEARFGPGAEIPPTTTWNTRLHEIGAHV